LTVLARVLVVLGREALLRTRGGSTKDDGALVLARVLVVLGRQPLLRTRVLGGGVVVVGAGAGGGAVLVPVEHPAGEDRARDGLGEPVALGQRAAEVVEELEDLLGLDPFGH